MPQGFAAHKVGKLTGLSTDLVDKSCNPRESVALSVFFQLAVPDAIDVILLHLTKRQILSENKYTLSLYATDAYQSRKNPSIR